MVLRMHVSRLSVAGDVPCSVPPPGVYLLTIKALPPWLQFGTLGVGLYLLFVAFTFYKGMTAGTALLLLVALFGFSN